MSYSSPIEIANRMTSQLEEDIMKVIFSYGIEVDKDELIKALAYDREQYEKGYADGQRAGERKKGKWIVTSEFEDCRYVKCNQCKVTQVFYYNKPLTNFCPNCGADMRGDHE